MAEKKFYTFIDIQDGTDGTKNCTTVVTLTKPEMKDLGDGKKILHCNAAISNQKNALSKALGSEIYASEDGTVWADVNFWNERADRMEKFVGDRTKVKVLICGKLSLRKWTAEDGSPRHRVQISVNNWMGMPTGASESPKQEEEEELY